MSCYFTLFWMFGAEFHVAELASNFFVTVNDFELLILLLPPLEYWDADQAPYLVPSMILIILIVLLFSHRCVP